MEVWRPIISVLIDRQENAASKVFCFACSFVQVALVPTSVLFKGGLKRGFKVFEDAGSIFLRNLQNIHETSGNIYIDCCDSFGNPRLLHFLRVRKIANSNFQLRHVCPYVRIEQLCSRRSVFYIGCFFFFRISVEKIHVSLKSDKNKGYFT